MLTSLHHQTVADLIGSDLTIGDQLRFLVTSNSMQPLINIGDTVVVEVINGNMVAAGDVIVIKRSDDFITHRAISPLPKGWLTKGDATAMPDPPAISDRIIGRVKEVEHANQSINLVARKWVYINPILAKLGKLEVWAFSYHQFLRIPFRAMSKLILKFGY
jgi:signal peptidase I